MTSTKYFNAHYNRHTRLQAAIFNVHRNTYRFGWTSEALSFEMNKIRQTDDWKRLPESWKSTLHGYADGIRDWFNWKYITHCYLCEDGLFRIQSTYDMPSERKATSLVDGTCTLVWKHLPHRVYSSINEQDRNILIAHLKPIIDTSLDVIGSLPTSSYIITHQHHQDNSITQSITLPIPSSPHKKE